MPRCFLFFLVSHANLLLATKIRRASAFSAIPKRSGRERIRSTDLGLSADFDFSSRAGWETYYQREDKESIISEWHSSVSLEQIADKICSVGGCAPCLIVGCGTSALPEVILAGRPHASLTLLDSSQSCIAQLQQRYGTDYSNVSLVQGDALKLTDKFREESFLNILDKGLIDALLCGEGWNSSVKTLIEQANAVLALGGRYVLVSYQLPDSTKDFLMSCSGDRWLWQFDAEGSNSRVGISVATKVAENT